MIKADKISRYRYLRKVVLPMANVKKENRKPRQSSIKTLIKKRDKIQAELDKLNAQIEAKQREAEEAEERKRLIAELQKKPLAELQQMFGSQD